MPTVDLSEAELHTLMAAMQFYISKGMDEEVNRSDTINNTATGDGDLKALEYDECRRLLFKLTVA